MKVTAVTPSAAASNPSHPDHARWVKEQTLKIEVGNAKSLGLSSRAAEIENTRQLERLAARKRRKPAPKKAKRIDTPEELAKQGVTVKAAPKRKMPAPPPCGALPCRICVWCKRAIRVSHIGLRARQDDLRARALQDELNAIMIAAISRKDYRDALMRELPFSRITGKDVDKAITQGIEWVCDRSVTFMGQWR